MNAIFIVLFFILYKVTTIYFVSCLSIVIAFIGVCIFLMNGLPFKVGGVATDGYNVLFLHKDKNAIKAFYQQMKIAQYMQEGYRLKDMPYDLFEIKENADLMNTLIVSIEVFRMNRLMDEHKFEEAYASMKSLLDQETGLIGIHKNLLLVDCMYCEKLLYEKESVVSKELKDFMKSMKENPSIIRIQYVLEKDFDKKNKILDHFEKVAQTYPYPSEIEQERELINLFRP